MGSQPVIWYLRLSIRNTHNKDEKRIHNGYDVTASDLAGTNRLDVTTDKSKAEFQSFNEQQYKPV